MDYQFPAIAAPREVLSLLPGKIMPTKKSPMSCTIEARSGTKSRKKNLQKSDFVLNSRLNGQWNAPPYQTPYPQRRWWHVTNLTWWCLWLMTHIQPLLIFPFVDQGGWKGEEEPSMCCGLQCQVGWTLVGVHHLSLSEKSWGASETFKDHKTTVFTCHMSTSVPSESQLHMTCWWKSGQQKWWHFPKWIMSLAETNLWMDIWQKFSSPPLNSLPKWTKVNKVTIASQLQPHLFWTETKMQTSTFQNFPPLPKVGFSIIFPCRMFCRQNTPGRS